MTGLKKQSRSAGSMSWQDRGPTSHLSFSPKLSLCMQPFFWLFIGALTAQNESGHPSSRQNQPSGRSSMDSLRSPASRSWPDPSARHRGLDWPRFEKRSWTNYTLEMIPRSIVLTRRMFLSQISSLLSTCQETVGGTFHIRPPAGNDLVILNSLVFGVPYNRQI